MASSDASEPTPAAAPVGRFLDFVRRFDLDDPEPHATERPNSPEAAIERLRKGNEQFATFVANCQLAVAAPPVIIPLNKTHLGLGKLDAFDRPEQRPFAIFVGCSDAREPAEILLGQGFNDLFTVRVAGNVLGDECIGSVLFALDKFAPSPQSPASGSLRLIVVIGHRSCGAVHAAVEMHEAGQSSIMRHVDSTPHHLAAIVTRIAPLVTLAAWAIDASYGPGASQDKKHTEVLTEIAVYLNAAWSAYKLSELVAAHYPGQSPAPVSVGFGVYDLNSHFVQGDAPPYASGSTPPKTSFGPPPDSPEWFPRTAEAIARTFAREMPNGDADLKERATSAASAR